MRCNELKNAFGPIPDDCYQALMTAVRSVKEETAVKKKVSFALVVALALVLAMAGAIALVSWQNTAQDILETEKESGYFKSWSADKKVALAAAIIEQGYFEMTGETEKLLSGSLSWDAAEKLAEDILSAFTGREVSEISFMEITQAAWGAFEQWSKEEQAWYSQLLGEMGLQGQDHTLYVTPDGPVDEPMAIAIARREIAKGYGVDEKVLKGYAVITSFQVPEFAEDTQAWWYVELRATDDMPPKDRLFSSFWVFVHPSIGVLYEPVESLLESKHAYEERAEKMRNDPLAIKMREFGETYGTRQQGGSLEAKALWSKTLAAEVLARYNEEPDFFNIMDVAFSSFTYGLPDDQAISQDEALEAAKKALVDPLGRKEEELRFFLDRPDVFYDITDAEKPLWKFFFYSPRIYSDGEAMAYYGKEVRIPNYKVEIDARTGELVKAFPVDYMDVDTLEEWKSTM